ncbi:MAG: NAD(P)H-hydrate dehydratase [Chloroflexota bacterium]
MVKLVTVEQMRQIEAAADAGGLSFDEMMDRAGRAAAHTAARMISGLPQPRITVIVGKGNNGGDGLVAAHYLTQQLPDAEIRLYLQARREPDQWPFSLIQQSGLFAAYAEDDHDGRVLHHMVASADLLLDALFGIGIRLPIKGDAARLLRTARQALQARRNAIPDDLVVTPARPGKTPQIASTRVLAIDCPSGLDCNTGALDEVAIPADETITFIAPKHGQVRFPGAQAVGRLHVATLGVPEDLEPARGIKTSLATALTVRDILPARPANSNKGTFGKALIIAGSSNYSGAAMLCGLAAYRAGAGLVTIGTAQTVALALAAAHPEPTWLPLPDTNGRLNADGIQHILDQTAAGYASLLLGPGWGQHDATSALLSGLLDAADTLPQLVLDADALNLLARIPRWHTHLPANTIITPHPGEMARLMNSDVATIQAEREAIAHEKAVAWGTILVLKGAHTVVAAPDGRVAVMPHKSDALATAGTGDVLAGAIAGFVAQGIPAFEAAAAGAYVQGIAGEIAAEVVTNTRGVIASDVLMALPAALHAVEWR